MLKAPFPYFGGKSTVAHEVWKRFGSVRNYVEPFFGSGAVLLGRPLPFDGVETVNDIDGMVSNFWRAVKHDPESVAHHADWPVIENDLHARHAWLIGQKESLRARLEGDPEYYDAKIAGWWCWGMSCWLGGGFCAGQGPWRSVVVNGESHLNRVNDGLPGVRRRIPCMQPMGVNKTTIENSSEVFKWLDSLSYRLRRVRFNCGDWSRICSYCGLDNFGVTAVFLDPPYSAKRDKGCYSHESFSVSNDVSEWAIRNASNNMLRIALSGYDGEHAMPEEWEEFSWKSRGGYANQGSETDGKANRHRERIWFSPHCLKVNKPTQKELF